MTAVHAARSALEELVQATTWLAVNLLPGTAPPYRAPETSAEKRAERDAQARLDRLVAGVGADGIVPLGESPAPMDLAISDLLMRIADLADSLADQVALTVYRPIDNPVRSAYSDPRPLLRFVAAHLPLAATVDPTLPDRIESAADGVTFAAHSQLGLIGDGQLLNTTCPWCSGRTSHHPTGGQRTMRVRAKLPDDKRSIVTTDPKDVTWLVVCEGGLCEPPEADCGTRHRGRPAWLLRTEGDWLAQRLERAS